MLFAGVALITSDVVRLSEFYRRILGVSSDDPENECHQQLNVRGAELAIMARTQRAGASAALMFTVDDADEKYERLLGLGIQI